VIVDRLFRISKREMLYVDFWANRGYKGHDMDDEVMEIVMARQKRGNAIEPIIGHCG